MTTAGIVESFVECPHPALRDQCSFANQTCHILVFSMSPTTRDPTLAASDPTTLERVADRKRSGEQRSVAELL